MQFYATIWPYAYSCSVHTAYMPYAYVLYVHMHVFHDILSISWPICLMYHAQKYIYPILLIMHEALHTRWCQCQASPAHTCTMSTWYGHAYICCTMHVLQLMYMCNAVHDYYTCTCMLYMVGNSYDGQLLRISHMPSTFRHRWCMHMFRLCHNTIVPCLVSFLCHTCMSFLGSFCRHGELLYPCTSYATSTWMMSMPHSCMRKDTKNTIHA